MFITRRWMRVRLQTFLILMMLFGTGGLVCRATEMDT